MATDALDAAGLRAWMALYVELLDEHRDELDRLNVYPVPDADTGANLLRTARAVVEEIDGAGDADVPAAVGRGAVRDAAGNSGIILSQVLRGVGETAGDEGGLDAGRLAEGLRRGCDLAYGAISDPVEGTMLSALRAAADAAEGTAGRGMGEFARAVTAAVHDAVEATPDQLDVLAEAGVVDAGARGLALLFQALVDALDAPDEGRRPDRTDGQPAPEPAAGDTAAHRYEVQYLLPASGTDPETLRSRLARIGGSVGVVEAQDLLRVHVHTDDIGAALEAGFDYGCPSDVVVNVLEEQAG